MKNLSLKTNCILAAAITGFLLSLPASADKPTWAGSGKDDEQHEKKKSKQRHEDERDSERYEGKRNQQRYEGERHRRESVEVNIKIGSYFDDRRREAVHDYYREQFRAGNCPPGLAKKRNGCMPPGQARKWAIGKPLPQGVEYHEVAPEVVVKIGQPPAGHRYVQVAADILLMAVGTGMIVDAIEDLGKKR